MPRRAPKTLVPEDDPPFCPSCGEALIGRRDAHEGGEECRFNKQFAMDVRAARKRGCDHLLPESVNARVLSMMGFHDFVAIRIRYFYLGIYEPGSSAGFRYAVPMWFAAVVSLGTWETQATWRDWTDDQKTEVAALFQLGGKSAVAEFLDRAGGSDVRKGRKDGRGSFFQNRGKGGC
jgi:hypothetical protein